MAEQANRFPSPWRGALGAHHEWWARVAGAPCSLLLCDYDGTLAPFQADKMQAVPYPGVAELLGKLADTPGAKLALISGRPVGELITLLPLAARLELFGSHGREHRSATGQYRLAAPAPAVQEALNVAEGELRASFWPPAAIERKSASLAVHTRGLTPGDAVRLQAQAEGLFPRLANEHLAVLPFDGGLELRSTDLTKAHAVEELLAGVAPGTPVAYLGDDLTDEDAFGALGERGLSLLVREEPRPSAAAFWLRPPGDLVDFLQAWLSAASHGQGTSAVR